MYKVYAGCDSEGTVLHGQPYSGPIDSQSIADFVQQTLLETPYSMSNTMWGVENLDWRQLENDADGDQTAFFEAYDYDQGCIADCDDDCQCDIPVFWLTVEPA